MPAGRKKANTALEISKRNLSIVDDILAGTRVKDLAAKHSITTQAIYHMLQDDDYRRILEHGQRQQISLVPRAGQALSELIDSEDEAIRIKAISQVQKNVGISPAHTSNVYIGQLVQGAQINATSGPVLDLLQAALDHKRQVVDVTPTGDNGPDSAD